jgi:hypothetical protein
MNWKKFIILLSMVVVSLIVRGQKEARTDIRPVIMNGRDSIVQAYILIGNLDYKPQGNLTYYWYYTERINCNKGGYAGNLLHDSYVLYDKDKRLIEKGYYNKGLKTGTWKRWYPDGEIQSIINWKDGLLEGKSLFYLSDGRNYMSVEYRRGKKDGKMIVLENDLLVTKIYRDGIERQSKPIEKMRSDKVKSDSNLIEQSHSFGFLKKSKTGSPIKSEEQ